ncbi:hypothetical protein SNE40_012202 [Patella caerulea]|uniref:Thioredoxin domain-containing protein n=1 Tax=Patella caerulea TaxID=87958 RepID=A0AAN8JR05_PATCE
MSQFFKDHKLFSKTRVELNGETRTEFRGDISSEEVLKGQVVALYFSASWSPPCQKFTSVLNEFYKELKEKGCDFQVVFISLDYSKDSMEEYFIQNHEDWLALPYDDTFKETLLNKYHITAIPKLVVIKEDGDTVTLKGRKDIQDKGMNCFRNWLNNSNVNSAEKANATKSSGAITDTNNETGNVTPTDAATPTEADQLDNIVDSDSEYGKDIVETKDEVIEIKDQIIEDNDLI